MGNGGFIDSSNSDLTFSGIHSALGEKSGYLKSGGNGQEAVIELLSKHEMVEHEDNEDSY